MKKQRFYVRRIFCISDRMGKVESNTLKMSVFGSAYFCIKYALIGVLCKKKDSIIAIV